MKAEQNSIETDFLVIGAGISGLSFAIKIAALFPDKKVTIVTKGDKTESNTKYAQGGISSVWDKTVDSFEQHIHDTIIAGDGLSKRKIVELVVKEAPDRIQDLISWGTEFDKDKNGVFSLSREGGHSQDRVLHHKDMTGAEIERALVAKVDASQNIDFLTYHFAIDLITEHQVQKKATKRKEKITCFGAYVLDTKNDIVKTFASKITLLASGGNGQIYTTTTNPTVATGDGLAMAYRAKAEVSDIEFIQFHPTALFNPGEYPAFLISEAVRGEGAKLKCINGDKFMHKYDPREELASRDIVARAIDTELKRSGSPHVYLDCTHMDYDAFTNHFPNITEKCTSLGIDIRKDYIPVAPAQHYICGGVNINKNAKTTIKNLYACGEVTCSGLHGANRLASNSLLEGIVFAHRAAQNIKRRFPKIKTPKNVPIWNDSGVVKNMENVLITHDKNEVKTIMSNYVGIVRSNERLLRAERRLHVLYQDNKRLYDHSELSADLCELRNMITTAYLVTQFSKNRTENKGGFYSMDLEN